MVDDDLLDDPFKPEAPAGFWFGFVMGFLMTWMVAMWLGLVLMKVFPNP